jgi:hypothetical protein
MAADGMSWKRIAAQLNREHVPPPGKGRQWWPATIGGILGKDKHQLRRKAPASSLTPVQAALQVLRENVADLLEQDPWRREEVEAAMVVLGGAAE